jgi:hypothetical protein
MTIRLTAETFVGVMILGGVVGLVRMIFGASPSSDEDSPSSRVPKESKSPRSEDAGVLQLRRRKQ